MTPIDVLRLPLLNWQGVGLFDRRQAGRLQLSMRPRLKIPLSRIAHTRSGDKGDVCNIGVIAYDERHYPILLREVTAERVKRHFGGLVKGDVERYELPNLGALNFLLHGALGGGGTVSLRTDAQGKTFGAGLLGLEIEVPEVEA
jgi:hypothetical protein